MLNDRCRGTRTDADRRSLRGDWPGHRGGHVRSSSLPNGARSMSPTLARFGSLVALSLLGGGPVLAQQAGGGGYQADVQEAKPVKPTGPAAKKADELIRGYTARIEKEIDEGRKEVERLRTELHELIDLRHEMTTAISELHGELAAK